MNVHDLSKRINDFEKIIKYVLEVRSLLSYHLLLYGRGPRKRSGHVRICDDTEAAPESPIASDIEPLRIGLYMTKKRGYTRSFCIQNDL